MATPFLELTNRINATSIKITYADVLLLSDIEEGRTVTAHHEMASERWKGDPEIVSCIRSVVVVESRRRAKVALEVRARALCQSEGGDPDSLVGRSDQMPEPAWHRYREKARQELSSGDAVSP